MKQQFIKDLCVFLVLAAALTHTLSWLYGIPAEAEVIAYVCTAWVVSLSAVRYVGFKRADKIASSIVIIGTPLCGLPMLWVTFRLPEWALFVLVLMVFSDLFMFRHRSLMNEEVRYDS